MNATNNRFSPGRRKLLIGTAGAAIAGALAWIPLKNHRESWIEQVVRDNLPGINLDPDSLQTFVQYMLGHERLQPPLVRATILADRFIPWLPAHISKAREGLEGVERHVLTEYLIGSNFFRVPDPKRETIVYGGAVIACINPFTQAPEPKLSEA